MNPTMWSLCHICKTRVIAGSWPLWLPPCERQTLEPSCDSVPAPVTAWDGGEKKYLQNKTDWQTWSHLTGDILIFYWHWWLIENNTLRDSGGGMTVTRKKSIQEVKCRIEDGAQDNKVCNHELAIIHWPRAPDVQVTKKLSEIRETLTTASSAGLKLKHLIIINDSREIDPVDISINLCELELWICDI